MTARHWQPHLPPPSLPLLSSPLIILNIPLSLSGLNESWEILFFFFFSPTCLKTCSKKYKKSQPTHLNFGAVNNWAGSRVPPRWGQLLESQREAAEKSSFIMKAQREPSVLMTNKPNEVCSPLHPAPASLLSDSERSRVARSNVRRRLSAAGMTRWCVWGRKVARGLR